MIIKFFVSDTCPDCIDVKHYFHILEQQYAPSAGVTLNNRKVLLYNSDNPTDLVAFIYHDVLTIPTIILSEDDSVEIERFVGKECLSKIKDKI